METEPSHLAVIGDQLFTDIAGAHTAEAIAILVEPMESESMWFFKVKRALERPFLRVYHRKAEKVHECKFGPAGNSDSFQERGYKSFADIPRYVREIGLIAMNTSADAELRFPRHPQKN